MNNDKQKVTGAEHPVQRQIIPDGEYRVRMLNGLLLPLNLIGDRKIIKGDRGYNICLGIKWGYFDIQKTDAIELQYDNGKIVDKIKFISEGHYKGQFYCRGKFFGDFELRRI